MLSRWASLEWDVKQNKLHKCSYWYAMDLFPMANFHSILHYKSTITIKKRHILTFILRFNWNWTICLFLLWNIVIFTAYLFANSLLYFEFFLIKQSGNFFLKQFILTSNEDSGPFIWTQSWYINNPYPYILKFDICYLKFELNYIYHI